MSDDYKDDSKTGLNPRQERFCREYIIDYNGTQAAIRAGYSAKNAASISSRLLSSNVKIQARIRELAAPIAKKCVVDAEYVIRNLIRVGERCLQQREPEMVWDKERRKLVQRTDEDGNVVYRFDSMGANRAFELIGRHVGMFDKRNTGDTGNLDKLIESIQSSKAALDKPKDMPDGD